MKTQKTRKILLALLSFVLLLSLICLSPVLQTNKTSNAIAENIPSISLDKVDSPISGRTSWTQAGRPLGFVLYLNDVSFAVNQVHLQREMTADSVAKITFTRGEKTETPVLICASIDGGYGSKSFFAFFFGGELADQSINEYQNGDKAIIEEGCVLECKEGSYLVSKKIEYVYDGSSWTKVVDSKEWTVTDVKTSVWVADSRKLGVDIHRSPESQTEDPLTNNNTGMLAHVNDPSKVTYTRNGKSEHPNIIIGNTVYVAYCFKGDEIGATDKTPRNGDLITIEEGFTFTYNENDFNRYYSGKLQYEYINGTWKACSYSSTATWKNASVNSVKSEFTRPEMGMGITTYSNDKDITAPQTDGIQLTVFDLKKITLFRQGKEFHPTRIIGATYTMNYMFKDLPITDKFVSGDMLKIEEGFSFIYNDTRYTYAETEVYVFTGSSWRVPSLNVIVKSMNVALNENIDAVFTFKLPIANVENGTNSIFVTVSGEETVVDLNTCVEKERDEEFVTFAVFIELNPTLLTADIQFYFRSDVGDNISCSKVYHKTIKEYCEYFIDKGTDEQKNLVKALLNYGGYSQLFFEVNTENLANDGLDPIGNVEVSDESVISQTPASGITFEAIQLYLETTPTLRFYFTIDGEHTIDNYAFKLTTNKDFELTPVYDEESGRYYVDAENIPAKLIGETFTISVENTTGNTVYTIKSSINCYIKMALTNQDTTEEAAKKANMLKALYVYGVCAAAFAAASAN